MHYLTGPEITTRQHPVTVSDLCGVEPLRDEQAHQWLIVKIPVVQEGGGSDGVCGGRGDVWQTQLLALRFSASGVGVGKILFGVV